LGTPLGRLNERQFCRTRLTTFAEKSEERSSRAFEARLSVGHAFSSDRHLSTSARPLAGCSIVGSLIDGFGYLNSAHDHEIKHDGYRLQVRREGGAVRLFTRRGYDWSGRYPSIAATATLLRARSSRSMAMRSFALKDRPACPKSKDLHLQDFILARHPLENTPTGKRWTGPFSLEAFGDAFSAQGDLDEAGSAPL
jgi:hypothetical protein